MDTRGWGSLALKEVQIYPTESGVATFDVWRKTEIKLLSREETVLSWPQSNYLLFCFLKLPFYISCSRKLTIKMQYFSLCMRKHRWAGMFSAMETQKTTDPQRTEMTTTVGKMRMWATPMYHLFRINNTFFLCFQWNCYHVAPRDFVADHYK